MMLPAYNPGTPKTKAGQCRVNDNSGLHIETLSQKIHSVLLDLSVCPSSCPSKHIYLARETTTKPL